MIIKSEPSQEERLDMQFAVFLRDRYGITAEEADETPHFLNFMEHLVERPVLIRDGKLAEKPIRRTLVPRVAALAALFRERSAPLQLTSASFTYARTLQRRYTTQPGGAAAVREHEICQLASCIRDTEPIGKRFKAILLLLWETGARPSEIIRRRYPEDIDSAHANGIVVAVPTSKTNPGTKTEHFKIAHSDDLALCAVCALREWVTWLGRVYRGPLFPNLKPDGMVIRTTYSSLNFSAMLKRAFENAGLTRRPFSAYSLRKGRATEAARLDTPIDDIRKGLRHRNVRQSFEYIDLEVLRDKLPMLYD